MSAKALEILEAKMSLKERRKFVANCNKQNPDWEKNIDGRTLGGGGGSAFDQSRASLFNQNVSFFWMDSKEGHVYWYSIYLRFTDEELSTRINLNE
jgi:hypothetical protein